MALKNMAKSLTPHKNSTQLTIKYVYKLSLNVVTSYKMLRETTNEIQEIVQSKQQSDPTSEKMLNHNTRKLISSNLNENDKTTEL